MKISFQFSRKTHIKSKFSFPFNFLDFSLKFFSFSFLSTYLRLISLKFSPVLHTISFFSSVDIFFSLIVFAPHSSLSSSCSPLSFRLTIFLLPDWLTNCTRIIILFHSSIYSLLSYLLYSFISSFFITLFIVPISYFILIMISTTLLFFCHTRVCSFSSSIIFYILVFYMS